LEIIVFTQMTFNLRILLQQTILFLSIICYSMENMNLGNDVNEFELIEGFKTILEEVKKHGGLDPSNSRPTNLSNSNFMKVRNTFLIDEQARGTLFDFWDDKLLTKTCLDGFEGVTFTPTLCHIIIDEDEDTEDFDKLFDNVIGKQLESCFAHYSTTDHPNVIIKPNHLTEGIGIRKIELPQDITDWEKMVECTYFDLISYYCLTKAQYVAFLERNKNLKVRKGLLVEPFVAAPFDGQFKEIGEIRFYTIFGRVEILSFQGKNCHTRDMGPAQYHRVDETNWKPNEYEKFSKLLAYKLFVKMQQSCLATLLNLIDVNTYVKQIDRLAFNLHMDFLRIDVFPLTNQAFYVNEIEIDSSFSIVGIEEYFLPKMRKGYARENQFISVENFKAKLKSDSYN